MNKVITVVAFLALTATGAMLFACGDSPANPPQTPSAPTTGGAPASSSATPVTSTPPKGGW